MALARPLAAPIIRLYVNGALHAQVASLPIRETGFHDVVHTFHDLGHVRTLEVEVEAWAVGWMGVNGTGYDVSHLEAHAFRHRPY